MMIKKAELIERLKAGETLKEYFRDGNCNAFYLGNFETVHGAGANQLIKAGKLKRAANSNIKSGREWEWDNQDVQTEAPQVEAPKQVSANVSLRDELHDAGCSYKHEDGKHVWRDKKDRVMARGESLADATRQAHQNLIASKAPSDEREASIHVKVESKMTLRKRIAELEAQNEALRNENARMKEDFDTIADNAKRIYNGDVDMESAQALALYIYMIARPEQVSTPPAQEAPKPKTVATRCRVNWSGRGFSSGSYEVLGYSQAKQVYVLNISSDDSKPMPKTVKMSDCEVTA